MKKYLMTAVVSVLSAALFVGPADGVDPVAAGYPDWQGVKAKNCILGREICPSDLRHKVTVVLDVDVTEKLQSQLVMARSLTESRAVGGNENWESAEVPRDRITLVICRGGAKKRDQVKAALQSKDAVVMQSLTGYDWMSCSFYDGVTFTGAPETEGKRPYVYVMGPEGCEPLFKGELNDASVKEARVAIDKARQAIAGWETKWRPFYGNISEPKFNTSLAKALEKGKTAKKAPLAAISKALLADVKSNDHEKAKEAQILFDAIEQTRSDLELRIMMEVGRCPHRASYDIQELLKYWPGEGRRVEAASAQIKANPEAAPLVKAFGRLMEWSRPDFTCKNASEAKKILQELNKMQKSLEALKESKNITIQNGAFVIGMKVDELVSVISSRLSSK